MVGRSNTLELKDRIISSAGIDPKEAEVAFDELDEMLSMNPRDGRVRDFFDCWVDAINHDYAPYEEKRVESWIEAAMQLREWYAGNIDDLPTRPIWSEVFRGGCV